MHNLDRKGGKVGRRRYPRMTTDYGLSAMTGVLPTIIVAGFATQIAK